MSRSVEEWIGKTDDAAIPPRVRVRVFDRFGGICQLTGRKIRPGDAWDLDHIVALINGGQHRESNLQPALRDKHRAKTKEDVALKSKAAKRRKKHLLRTKSRFPCSRDSDRKKKLNGEVVAR